MLGQYWNKENIFLIQRKKREADNWAISISCRQNRYLIETETNLKGETIFVNIDYYPFLLIFKRKKYEKFYVCMQESILLNKMKIYLFS